MAENKAASQADPLLTMIGMAGENPDSPGDLAARHDEYLGQWQREDDSQRPIDDADHPIMAIRPVKYA